MLVPWNDGARLVAGFRTALSEFVCVGVSLRMQNKLQATRRWLWILKSRSAASPAAIETSRCGGGDVGHGGGSGPKKRKTQATNSLARLLAAFSANSKTLSLRSSISPFYSFVCVFVSALFLFPTEIESAGNDLQIQFKFGSFRHASFTWHACKFVQK